MKKYLFFLLLAVSCMGIAQQTKIVPFQYKGQWGLVDSKRKEFLPPEYLILENVKNEFNYYILAKDNGGETKVYNAKTTELLDIGGFYQSKKAWFGNPYLFTTTQQTSFLYNFDTKEKIVFDGLLSYMRVLQLEDQKYYVGKNSWDGKKENRDNSTYTIYSYGNKPKMLMKNVDSFRELYGDPHSIIVGLAVEFKNDKTRKYSVYNSNLEYIGKSYLDTQELSKLLKQEIHLDIDYKEMKLGDGQYEIGQMISENLKFDTQGNLIDIRKKKILISAGLGINYWKLDDAIITGYKIMDNNWRMQIEFYIDTIGKYFPKEVPMIPAKYLRKKIK